MEKNKKSLVLGCSGMDGSHMVDLLLDLGYDVYGASNNNESTFLPVNKDMFKFHKIDIREYGKIEDLIVSNEIDRVFNFAGITFSPDAEKDPDLTFSVNRDAPIRIARFCQKLGIPFIQSSSSEVFGDLSNITVDENSIRNPLTVYANAKFDVDHEMKRMREDGSKMYNAILFPHESERRKNKFLIRKICFGVAYISRHKAGIIELGNLDSSRDWSSSRDFVKWMHLISEKELPGEYIMASGNSHTVREVLDIAFRYIGIDDWTEYVKVSEKNLRSGDIKNLTGDPSKIKKSTDHLPSMSFSEMIENIIKYDLQQ